MNDDPTQQQTREERLQEILLKYVEAAEAGRAPEPQQFIAQHVQFAQEIADFLAGYQHLNTLATPLRDAEERRPRLDALAIGALSGRAPKPERAPASEGGAGDSALPDLGRLGDYRLVREIGRGGMGIVYEAEQITLRRRVALKILPFAGGVDSRQLQRFRNEAEAAAHLHHSHIVPVFAVGSERGVHYYAMQFIEGQSLATLIADLGQGKKAVLGQEATLNKSKTSAGSALAAGTISTEHSARSRQFFRTVAIIGKQIAEALEYAHQRGIVHRDIKPANLLLDNYGEVWVTDFGLASCQSQVGLTLTGELLGTLRYASPEQAMAKRGLIDHHTDIYSLCATLYELLTLNPVFDGNDRHALLHQIGFEEPKPPRAIDPTIPVELETIILKALAKNPGERYSSAQDLADDLQRFLEDKPIQAKRPTVVDRARKWMRRHPAVVVASVVMLVVGMVGFAASTLLVAQEQWRTKHAYNKLTVEEQRSKHAYEELALEEKRTKKAYEELAVQQDRTKQALEAEAVLRDRAEGDYEQARRALEMIVQFSEGELAHNPAQQDVRRRLLETVLDYYEDFMARHEDDFAAAADLSASRQRAAAILTELATLRGPTLLAVVQNAAVQEDLQLQDEQKKKLSQLVGSFNKPIKDREPSKQFDPKFNPKDKGPAPIPPASAVEKAIGEILSVPQKKRFQQILLQVQQQGRHGFSDPTLDEALGLTSQQRADIRKIQNDAHSAWADHLFSDKKIGKPAAFWFDVQNKILATLEPDQRDKWQQLAGPTVLVELREGYPFDGQDVKLPRPGPAFGLPGRAGKIVVWHLKNAGDFAGSGFGHKSFVDDKQYYCWQGKEIPPTAFEIAVSADALTEAERQWLVVKRDQEEAPTPGPGKGWVVLFRSMDPSVWNTEKTTDNAYAIAAAQAPRSIRYLRLKRMDTGETLIMPITYAQLTQQPKSLGEGFAWNGSAGESFRARHLGIVQGPALDGPARKGPPK
jgi:serine/threonine protein kinase